MRRAHRVAVGAVAAMFAFASNAVAKPPDVNSSKLRAAVTVDGIVEHQQALQNIADMNGGTRHTETPGYPASVEYVQGRWRRRLKRHGHAVQHARLAGDAAAGLPAAEPCGEDLHARHRGRRQQPGGRLHHLRSTRPPRRRQRARRADQRHRDPEPGRRQSNQRLRGEDFPAATDGAISLIQRGTCPFVQKLVDGAGGGCGRRDLFNEGDSAGRMNAGFRDGPTNLAIPAVFSSFAVGKELYNAFKAGQNPTRAPADERREHRPFLPAGDRRDAAGRPRPRGARRRAPGLRARRAGHQRRRVGHGLAARARRADLPKPGIAAAQQDPAHVVRR